jgi:hypothetical protein
MREWISSTFSGPLSAIFHPIDKVFTPFGPGTYKFFAVGLFLATICWVMFVLKKEYVNLDRHRLRSGNRDGHRLHGR